MITGIALAAVDTVVLAARLMLWISRGDKGCPRNFQFRQFRAARELLDRAAVEVARRKIHAREVAAGLQHIVNETDALDQLRPIHVGDQAHARDDVSDRYVCRALSLMLVTHDLVGGRSLRRQAPFQPHQGRHNIRILVPQPLDELDREGLRQRGLFVSLKDQGDRLGRVPVHAQEPVGQGICFPARCPAAHDALGRASKIFHEHDPQRDRDRP